MCCIGSPSAAASLDPITAGLSLIRQQFNPTDSSPPALVLDSSNRVVSYQPGNSDKLNTPVLAALRQAGRAARVPDLQGLGHKLFIIGDSAGHFDGAGIVNNFAPSEVHVLLTPGFATKFYPGSDDYADQMLRKRGTKIIIHPETEGNSIVSVPNSNRLTECSVVNADCLQAYSQIEQLFRSQTFPTDKLNDVLFKGLMIRLHDLADANVDKLKGGPFAAAIVSPSGEIVAVASNRVVPENDAFMHAEATAIERALDLTGRSDLADFILVTTSQCCIGCTETMARTGISRVLFANTSEQVESNSPFFEGPLNKEFLSLLGIHEMRLPRFDNLLAFETFRKAGKPYLTSN